MHAGFSVIPFSAILKKNNSCKENKLPLFRSINEKLLKSFRLNHHPVVRVYNGYNVPGKIIVFGHVLKLSPFPRRKYRRQWLVNMFSMLRLFMVKPYKSANVSLEWEGERFYCKTQLDGFFRFEFAPSTLPKQGWHKVSVKLEEERYRSQNITGTGEVHILFDSKYVFVSDIDDTFLISHSSRLRKRLYVLFTKNARSRRPFTGVVRHYCLLAGSWQEHENHNPFIYVSSSEWNLFYYIKEFARQNKLPKGVYLLNELKQVKDILRTGQNKHATKFFRIARIVEAYPERCFVLFGDDSQEDPNIYAALADHFGNKIFAVYIRQVHRYNYKKVNALIDKMTTAGIHCCYFRHSIEAIEHSRSIGLISEEKFPA